MINGDSREFVDGLYYGDERFFLYNGKNISLIFLIATSTITLNYTTGGQANERVKT